MHSQNHFSAYEKLLEKEDATDLNSQVDSLIQSARINGQIEEAIKVSHAFFIRHYRKKDFGDAVKYGSIEIDLYERMNKVNEDYIQVLYNVGRASLRNDDPEGSIQFHEKAVLMNFNDKTVGRSYFEMGNGFFTIGDYYKAVDHYNIALLHLKSSGDKEMLIRRSLDLSNRYEQINTPESLQKKIVLLEEILELSREVNLNNRDFYALYNSLASYYNNDETFDFDKSKYYQNEFLQRAINSQDSSAMATSYGNLGNLYTEVENDSASIFFNKAISLYGEEKGATRTLNNLAYYQLSKNQPKIALSTVHRSLAMNLDKSLELDETPSPTLLSEVSDKFSVLHAIDIKCSTYLRLFETEKDPKYLNLAKEHLNAADALMDLLLIESAEEQSQLHWRDKASSLYSKAILVAYHLDDTALAFYFNEKKKALLLTESIIENSEKSGLPARLLNRELSLKKQIIELELAISKGANKASTETEQKALFEAKQAFQNFQDSLKIQYPNHFLSQQKSSIFSLEDIQKQLDSDTAVATYVWDTSDDLVPVIFGIFITNNQAVIINIEDKDELSLLLDEYRRLLSRPFEKNTEKTKFENTSRTIYESLFPSEEIKQLTSKRYLIIVPDGQLHNVPFEAFIINDKRDYLLHRNSIGYAYSLSFLEHNSKVNRDASNDIVGFSPVVFSEKNLDSLPNSLQEINNIKNIIKGDYFVRDEATKSNFLKTGKNYKILHLATHADASASPWIAFKDSILELPELYAFRNEADLVVLSACNTSLGEVANGEGVMSLARGFFHSGANSVVSSLWNVNDKSTAALLSVFFENLSDGQSKSEALRNAKLSYINSHSLSETSPYYWASFVLIGNAEKVTLDADKNSSLIIFISSILLIIGILLYFRIKR